MHRAAETSARCFVQTRGTIPPAGVGALTDDAPVYDRPRATETKHDRAIAPSDVPVPADFGAELLRMCGTPNTGSRAWIWRQYDHIVRGGTLVRPGSDAAVVRVPCEKDGTTIWKHLADPFYVRGSNTEPIVRIIAEAPQATAAAQLCAEASAVLKTLS